jgi:hypothetical protein
MLRTGYEVNNMVSTLSGRCFAQITLETTKKYMKRWIYTSKWQKCVDECIQQQRQPCVVLQLGRGRGALSVRVARRPEQEGAQCGGIAGRRHRQESTTAHGRHQLSIYATPATQPSASSHHLARAPAVTGRTDA